MTRPINRVELFVWLVRAVVVGILVALVFGCMTNAVTFTTNPSCVIRCTAETAQPAASGVSIRQSIKREGVEHGDP